MSTAPSSRFTLPENIADTLAGCDEEEIVGKVLALMAGP